MVPQRQTGEEIWAAPKVEGRPCLGRNHGPLTVNTTIAEDTILTLVTIDDVTGQVLSEISSRPDPRLTKVYQGAVVSGDGEVVAVSGQAEVDVAPTRGHIRIYRTRTGERLLNIEQRAVWASGLSHRQDRILVYAETEEPGVWRTELRTLSTYELVAAFPDIREHGCTFDETSGDIYVSEVSYIHVIRAADGRREEGFGTPHYLTVARLPGTDTLIGAGRPNDSDFLGCYVIDLRTKRMSYALDKYGPDGKRFTAVQPVVQFAADGSAVYISQLRSYEPNGPTMFPVLVYTKGQGLGLFTEGVYTRDSLNGFQFAQIAFSPDRGLVIGGWRSTTVRGLRGYSTVLNTTTVTDLVDDSPLASIRTDGRYATCTDATATINGVYDLEGRALPAPCMDERCTRIAVQALPAGSYLVRVLLHGEERSLTLSIVR
jgi:hypothetical protein